MSLPLDRVHLNWGGIFPCEPDWRWDTAITPLPDFDLWAVFAGRGALQAPEGPLGLAPGDCLLLRPRTRYVARTEAEDPLLVHVVHFGFAGGAPDVLPALRRPLLDVTFFRGLTTRAIHAHLAGRADEADDWLRAALREIAHLDLQPDADARTRRIEQVCAEIAAAPRRRWVVGELAAACHLSTDHFTKVFKAVRGVTPREFILRHRIDAARRLLLSSSHSVGRIAELTGFTDISHFSRQFKARTGRSPTRFRRGR